MVVTIWSHGYGLLRMVHRSLNLSSAHSASWPCHVTDGAPLRCSDRDDVPYIIPYTIHTIACIYCEVSNKNKMRNSLERNVNINR